MKKLAPLAVAAVLVLGLGQAAPASAPPAGRASSGVSIANFAFGPHRLSVAKGTTVVFSNHDGVAHTATDRGVFDTGHIRPGRSVAVRFKQKGTFVYHCTIHPEMRAKIVVH
ncbi:MAG TPA: plastocyanin/azurin family copper-binding protein [Solirubrobacterales bacterium]|nr:plastocyanin/azurin family copper-binding protein [Solirubrobacterales bacterium]